MAWTRWLIVAVLMAFAWLAMPNAPPWSWMQDVQAAGIAALAAALAARLLVSYFEWRMRVARRCLDEAADERTAPCDLQKAA